jgi:hypothetical protein
MKPEALAFCEERPRSIDDDLFHWAIHAEMLIRQQHGEKEALQATIDKLMLEYCPQDMSVEQIVNWSNHQRKEKP